MKSLLLLVPAVLLSACNANLGAHLPTKSDAPTTFVAPTQEAPTSLNLGSEDISSLTSFPEMVDSKTAAEATEVVRFDRLQEQGSRFGVFYDDGRCLPGETDPGFFEIRRRRR